MDTGVRVHYLDWGGPEPGGGADAAGASSRQATVASGAAVDTPHLPPVLLLHGIADTAWWWTPVARRLRGAGRVLAIDQRGHGLSDSPREGYELASLAIDVLTVGVANGWVSAAAPIVVAGHGFGACVAVAAAVERPEGVAGLALIDGGMEDVGQSVGDDPEQVVKGLAEPPEVMQSMAAWLADRRDFDPPTWDADQERAARARVDEKHAGHIGLVARPQALLATVRAMLAYRPDELLPLVRVPTLIAVAGGSAPDDEQRREREIGLEENVSRLSGPVRVARFPSAGHNLARYEPGGLSAEIAQLVRIAAGRPRVDAPRLGP